MSARLHLLGTMPHGRRVVNFAGLLISTTAVPAGITLPKPESTRYISR